MSDLFSDAARERAADLAPLAQRLRPDAVTERDAHELYQQNAPKVTAGLYLVPKVIE